MKIMPFLSVPTRVPRGMGWDEKIVPWDKISVIVPSNETSLIEFASHGGMGWDGMIPWDIIPVKYVLQKTYFRSTVINSINATDYAMISSSVSWFYYNRAYDFLLHFNNQKDMSLFSNIEE